MTVSHLYIGLMSGTSMDSIDAALVSFENDHIKLIDTLSIDIPISIKEKLTILLRGENISLKLLGEADVQMGNLFAEAVLKLLQKSSVKPAEIIAIGSHGQTIYHHPHGEYPFTMQIGDPNIIVAQTNITTVADFRRRDIALGGQGAPLVPAFHEALFGRQDYDQYIVNIGGIANVTYLSSDKTKPIIGFDTGPGNTLLDQWCERECECECEQCYAKFLKTNCARTFDIHGHWAKSGTLNPELLAHFLDDPYFQKPYPKSTGREYFNLAWLKNKLAIFGKNIASADIQNTLTELTAKTIATAISHTHTHTHAHTHTHTHTHAHAHAHTHTHTICGGGVYNHFLMQRLQANCTHATVQSSEAIDMHPKWIEAMAFAWLAKQTNEKNTGNCPSVTGAKKAAVLGGLFSA